MKSIIFALALTGAAVAGKSQTVSDFESFTLAPNSAYNSTVSAPFQTNSAVFNYKWDNSFGGFWAGGCAYTNKKDSITGTFSNLYGVRAYTGYTNSANYVVAQNNATIKLKAPYDKVEGFYITNTTYAYKVIKSGNSFSRKFGDTTGTKSGTTIAQGSYPDFFKVTVKGYKNGTMKSDSAVYYLADYRFSNNTQDYITDTWQWFNTSSLGSVDSIRFFMYSSDNGSFGMNTPAFFAFDNFTTSAPNPLAVGSQFNQTLVNAYPNPFSDGIKINLSYASQIAELVLRNMNGEIVAKKTLNGVDNEIDTQHLAKGIYLLQINSNNESRILKLVKN